jgi:hypothetical protein
VVALMILMLRSWMRIRTRVRAWARPTPMSLQAPGHEQRDGARLIDAVGADAVVGVGAGAEVSFGSGLVGRGGGG